MAKYFAETLITYPGGIRGREPIPEEIRAYGFKPPVRLPSGHVRTGDMLPGNWWNDILNNAYRATSVVSMDVISYVTNSRSYLQVGDYIVAFGTVNGSASGSETGTVNIANVFAEPPRVISWIRGNVTPWAVMASRTLSNTQFRFSWRNQSAMVPAAPAGESLRIGYIAFGKADAARGERPLPNYNQFAYLDYTYVDGQFNKLPVSAEQWDYGFRPTYYPPSSPIVVGDTLPAPMLNFLLADIFDKSKDCSVNVTGTVNPTLTIKAGDAQLVFGTVVTAATATPVVFPFPFAGTPCVVASGTYDTATPVITTLPAVLVGAVSGGNSFGGLRAINASSATLINTCHYMAIGRNAAATATKNNKGWREGSPGYFARTLKMWTAVDPGKSAPSALVYANGYVPVNLATDASANAAIVRAQHLNYQLNELYNMAAACSYAYTQSGGSWEVFENDTQYFAVFVKPTGPSEWASGYYELQFPMPIKAGTVPFIWGYNVNDTIATAAILTTGVDAGSTITATSARIFAASMTTFAAAAPGGIRVFMIAQKP